MGVVKNTVGEFRWTPPSWIQRLGAKRLALCLAGLLILSAIAIAGYRYYQSLPVPPRVVGTATPPDLSPIIREQVSPQPVYIDFVVKTDPRQPVDGTTAIARVDLINASVAEGITLSPSAKGSWDWVSDTQLRFRPEQDWPAGQTYTVTYSREIFAPDLDFESFTTQFTTPSFAANLQELKFYQNPAATSERKIVATLAFTHTVDAAAISRHLTLGLRKDGQTVNDKPVPLKFEVTLDKAKRTAYVHSELLEIPAHETFATLSLDKQFQSENSISPLTDDVVQTLRIPDISSYFKVENSQFLLARDQDDEPQQSVTLSFSDRVPTSSLEKKLSVYLLPTTVSVNGQRSRKSHWQSPREVTPDILNQSQLVKFDLNPQDTPSAALHSLRLDVQVKRYYYLRVEQGLVSDGDFQLSTAYDTVFYAPAYPQEVKVAQDGAILPLTGSHKVHFVSRGLSALKIEIGRLLEGDINHLASQTNGDMKNAQFSHYNFNQDNLAEREERFITLPSAHAKTASFSQLDLSDYLNKGGYYFVRVSGWDQERDWEVGGSDQRLVLITDLGFVAKVSANGQQDLFVHSLATGSPIPGANIELLGKNGLPILRATTNGDGHAKMDNAREFLREKSPTVYVVRNSGDAVFMPFGRYTRQLDFSRFDTSGEYTAADNNQLRAQLFTERDLFRPGDTVHLAGIVKRNNWQSLERLPLLLQVRDPRGQLIVDQKLQLPTDGFIEHVFDTDVTASTGSYDVSLYTAVRNKHRTYIGGHQFKVEEFQPDRLKIQSNISGQPLIGWVKPTALSVEVQLDNLFGTPASERRVQGSLVLNPARMVFNDFPNFVFIDPLRRDSNTTQTIERTLTATQTDQNGAASLPLNLEQYDQGIYELLVYTEGFEAGGGRSVKSQARVMLSPLDHLVGYKASGDLDFIRKESSRSVEFIALNNIAEAVSLENLTLQVLEQRFVSTLVKQQDGTFAYQSISKDTELSQQSYAVNQNGTIYSLPTDTPGRFVIQLKDANGTVVSRVNYLVAGSRNVAGNLEQNAELELALNKSSYAPGENIEVQITAPYSGIGLITIERDSVVAYKWFRTSTLSSVQSIQVPSNLEGNAYVNIAFMRGLDSPEIYLNPLSYALKPFSIKRDARTINVSLNAPETVIPGDTLNIGYSTDQPSKIVLFAVDQGILQVANYQRPQPLDFFLRKRALRVATYQLADLVLPEFVTPQRAAAPGGGEAASAAGKNLNPFRRKTDLPVVFWSGLMDAGPDSKNVSYVVPDYFNGQLTIMAVAVANDAVGDAVTNTQARGPFVISPNLPVSVAPGDEFDVSVGLANNLEGSGVQAAIELSAKASPQLVVVGDSSQVLNIDEGRESSTVFRVRATDKTGSGSLLLMAGSGTTQIKLNSTISVRPATPYVTTLQTSVHENDPIKLAFNRSLRAELAVNSAAASTQPVVLVSGLQQYLDNFPHACAEQIVSKIFPQLGLYGQDDQFDQAQFRAQFSQLIQKLRSRQTSNGGFRFWQSSNEAANFPSVYISHFLTDAKTLDLAVPRTMLESALSFLREIAASPATSIDDARLRAYAIYVLTRNGTVTTNYLTSLQEYLQQSAIDWKTDITATYMAASYQLVKLDDLANDLIDAYVIKGGNEMFSDFDTRLGRDAQYVYLLAQHFPGKLKRLDSEQLRTLTTPITQNRFNTLSSSYTILALQAYAKANAENGDAVPLSISTVDGSQLSSAELVARAMPDHQTLEIVVSGSGDRLVFATMAQTGFDQSLPDKAMAQGLEIDRRYLDQQGNSVTSATLGEELTVQLRVRSSGKARSNVAVVDLLPGGFEVLGDSVRQQQGNWSADYMDVREDRVVTYATFNDQLTEIRYNVKATSAGNFTIPAAYANSMYDLTVQAHTAGGQFEVKRP